MAVHARETKAGLNIATSGSWSTGAASATAVGAGDGHYVRDDLGLVLTMQQSMDDSASQNFIGSVQSANAEAITSAIPLYLHYHDTWINVLWALAFGTGGTSPTQLGASTAYTNTFEPATTKTGRYATIVQDKKEDIFEVPGAKFTGFEMRSGESGRMEIDFQFIGDLAVEDSSTNTATEVGNLTFPIQGIRTFLDDCVIRINTQGGTTLTAADEIDCSSLRIRFSQPLDVRYTAGQTTIIEPEEHEFPEFDVEMEAGRYTSTWNAFFAGHRNTTAYKMDITFTGAVIPALATAYALLFQFPNIRLRPVEIPVPGGAGQLFPRMTAMCLSTTSAPTGMTGVTAPMRLVTTGVMSGNPFA